MIIKTDLGSADQIMLNVDPIQVIEGNCFNCGSRVQLAIPNEIMDYRSMYVESVERLKEAFQYNGKLTEELRLLKIKLDQIKGAIL